MNLYPLKLFRIWLSDPQRRFMSLNIVTECGVYLCVFFSVDSFSFIYWSLAKLSWYLCHWTIENSLSRCMRQAERVFSSIQQFCFCFSYSFLDNRQKMTHTMLNKKNTILTNRTKRTHTHTHTQNVNIEYHRNDLKYLELLWFLSRMIHIEYKYDTRRMLRKKI